MKEILRRAVAIALVGTHITACKSDDSPPDVLLVVETAQQQPSSDGLGIIVLVQARGGKWIEVETRGATLADGKGSACFLAPQGLPLSQSLTTLLLLPTQDEAVITVRLLPDGPETNLPEVDPAAGASGNASATAFSRIRPGACRISGAPLREVTKPVSRKPVPPPVSYTGGASSTGGSTSAYGSIAGSGVAGETSSVAGNNAGGAAASGGAMTTEAGASSGGQQGIGGVAETAGTLSIAGGAS